jgi:hypothetical protein
MNYTITDDRLLEVFSSVMKEYSELEVAERSYDFHNYDEGRYVDLDVYNYYKDVDEDWEDDNWILQVQYMKGDAGKGMELPILRYSDWWFRTIIPMFGDYFELLLKEWFNKTYLPKTIIKTVTKEQD